MQFAYGKANRPSTPIRTVVNGVYGTVADFEMTERSRGFASTRRLEMLHKPSRGHTRATTMASDQVLRNTLTAKVNREDSNTDLFKLRKFQNVESRLTGFHVNPQRKSRQATAQANRTLQPLSRK